jgi:hypothetical protein
MPNRSTLANHFASLFHDPLAQGQLARLRHRTRLPIFNLTASSLRHLRRWFDRLEDINNGRIGSHGNFLSDPAGIGLVDDSVSPPVLTPAGQEFLSYKPALHDDPAQAEYRLLKILYFSNYRHESTVQQLLDHRRDHMLTVLSQLNPSRRVLLTQPSLLVISELIATFSGAIQGLLALSDRDLIGLVELGEDFKSLCLGPGFPTGLSHLCGRIGNEYTRAEERRLHQIVSMALLTIAQTIPPGGTTILQIPSPYSNLLTEQDIFNLHTKYTSDISVWFDGVSYQVSTSFIPTPIATGATVTLQEAKLQPQIGIPKGTGSAGATDKSRNKRRAAQQAQITVTINPLLSEAAEDFAEREILQPQYGAQLVRVGHRSGEIIALPDGIVPGADFYVIDAINNPTEFIEIKCISGNLPANISLTRAEYLRACQCAANGIPYRLILVDLTSRQCYVINDFAEQVARLELGEVIQFTIKVG